MVKLNVIGDPDYLPYVERENKYEFISLGIEPIFTTNFESDIDLDSYPEMRRGSTKLLSKVTGLKKMHAMKTDKLSDIDYNDIKISKVMPNSSKTLKSNVSNYKNIITNALISQINKYPSVDKPQRPVKNSVEEPSVSQKSSMKVESSTSIPNKPLSPTASKDSKKWNHNLSILGMYFIRF